MDFKIRQQLVNLSNNIDDQNYIDEQIKLLNEIKFDRTTFDQFNGFCCLDNIGNTCYMNSIIQCLRHVLQFFDIPRLNTILLLNCGQRKKILLFIKFLRIIYMMNRVNNCKIVPMTLKLLIGVNFDQFNNGSQNDAHELLISLLQSFHDILSYPVEYQIDGNISNDYDKNLIASHNDWISYYKNKESHILNVFGGQLRTEILCANCKHISLRFDPILGIDLSLPVDQSQNNIEQCFDQFMAVEQLNSDNLYSCEQCHQKTQAYKQQTLWKLPKYLIIKLNRFSQSIDHGRVKFNKIDKYIQYPVEHLDISKYCSCGGQNTVYNLSSVCCHMGSMMCGHYYSYCYSVINHEWIRYDDSRITHVNPSDVISPNAYILFYQQE